LLGLTLFLLLVLAGLLVYIAWCQWSISYRTSATQLNIRCGGVRHIVPYDAITSVHGPGDLTGDNAVTVRQPGLAGLVPLPGYYIGSGESKQLGRVVMVATRPPSSQVFVVTPTVTYGLSPLDVDGFVRQLKKREYLDALDELDPVQPAREASVRTELSGPSGWASALWADRPARTFLLVGLGLNLLLFLYLSFVYKGLPQLLPLHWNSQAEVDFIGDPTELLRLPVFALVVWWINAVAAWLVLSRERAATLFLLAGAVAVQIVFAAGVLSIVGRP
jgi:hypothetical protein